MRIFTKGGPWKNAEDEVLKAAVMKYGTNQWSRVASLLISKSAKQCKARWEEWLDPNIKKTEWTREEEEKLLHLAKIAPNMWRMIASQVGRTAAQCLEHYEKLLDQVQGRDMESSDDPRRLKPGEIDPNPEARPARPDPIDMSEDTKEMLSEARARLENTKGKKAKRKAREQELEKARRLASLQKRRELKAAGIHLKPSLHSLKKSKARNVSEIDYNHEIPLFRRPPPGVFDVTREQVQSEKMAIDYNREAVQKVYHHQDKQSKRKWSEDDQLGGEEGEEEALKKMDQERIKKRKKEAMPDFLAEQTKKKNRLLYPASGSSGGGASSSSLKRSKLVLPKPQISDAELEEIGKLSIRGVAALSSSSSSTMDPLLSGGGSSQKSSATPVSLMMGQSMMRTPRRTPAMVDTVKLSAQNLIALQNQQTPLKGGKNIELNEQFGDFGGMTPAKHVAPTPNPLSVAIAAATPSMMTPGGAINNKNQQFTPMMTPVMRDGLHINHPSPSSSTGLTPSLIHSQKMAFYKQQLRDKLSSLPAPVTNSTTRSSFHISTDDQNVDEEPYTKSEYDDDMGEIWKKQELLKQSKKREELNRRTQVVQRNLPRPSSFDPSALRESITDSPDEQDDGAHVAKLLIHQEMIKLVQHDSVAHPITEKQSKNNRTKKKLTTMAINKLEYPRDDLMQRARHMIAIEQTKFDTPSFEEFSEMWDSCASQVFPTNNHLLEQVYMEEKMKTGRMEKKLNILTGGYMHKLSTLQQEIDQMANDIHEKQRELQSFAALQDLERNAMRTRELRLIDDIQMVRSKERALQDRYRELLQEKQHLQAKLTIIN